MNRDPNFQRHLQTAICKVAASQTNPDEHGISNAAKTNPAVLREIHDLSADHPAITNRPTNSTVSPEGQENPGQKTGQSNSVPTDKVTPAQGHSPVQAVASLYQQVTGPQSMTPELRQEFQKTIQAADGPVASPARFDASQSESRTKPYIFDRQSYGGIDQCSR